MKLIFTIKNQKTLNIRLKEGRAVKDEEDLTISQGFDILLIRVLDNLLSRNKIDRLSIESVEIQGKVEGGSVSGMVLKTIKNALKA